MTREVIDPVHGAAKDGGVPRTSQGRSNGRAA